MGIGVTSLIRCHICKRALVLRIIWFLMFTFLLWLWKAAAWACIQVSRWYYKLTFLLTFHVCNMWVPWLAAPAWAFHTMNARYRKLFFRLPIFRNHVIPCSCFCASSLYLHFGTHLSLTKSNLIQKCTQLLAQFFWHSFPCLFKWYFPFN